MTDFLLIASLIISTIILIYFFSKRRRKSVDYNRLIELLDNRIFPGGAEQKKEGARKIAALLKNRIGLQEAEAMYIRKIALFYFEKYDSNNEALIHFLSHRENSGINFFESIELHNFFIREHQQIETDSWKDAFLRLEIVTQGFRKKYDYTILEVNSQFEKMFNSTQIELNGRSLRLVLKSFDTALADAFQNLCHSLQSQEVEYFDNYLNKKVCIVAYPSVKGQIVTFISEVPEREAGRSVQIA